MKSQSRSAACIAHAERPGEEGHPGSLTCRIGRRQRPNTPTLMPMMLYMTFLSTDRFCQASLALPKRVFDDARLSCVRSCQRPLS